MLSLLPPPARLALVILLIGLGLFGLDRLLYSGLLFALPNYSGWDSFRWYNFEYNLRRLEREAVRDADGRPLVLVVGSSIAQYSAQTESLERELKQRGVDARVQFAVHSALLPTDLYYYRDRILAARPDLVVYLTNPADLDLERYLPPWEGAGGFSDVSMEHYLAIRHPMLYYYPGRFALEHRGALEPEEISRLLVRAALYSMRFKDDWRALLRFNEQVRTPPLRGYLNYQGQFVPELLWRDGWTGACFSLRREWLDENGSLWLQVPAELLRPDFRIELFIDDFKGKPECARGRGAPAATLSFGVAGWQRVELPLPAGPGYFARLSHVLDDGTVRPVTPASPIWAGRGVRLPGQLGRAAPATDVYYQRGLSLEDARLRSLSDAAYDADFERRVHPQNWRDERYRGLRQFNTLRLAKYATNWYEWSEIYQAREVRRVVSALRAANVRVLLVNNPENPLTRVDYEDNAWYAGYVAFFQGLDREDEGVGFADLRDRQPRQHFVDAHHLTYYGVNEMAPLYADLIQQALGRGP